VIRVAHEFARTCNGCGRRGPVTALGIGAEQIRVCTICWLKLETARTRVIVERLDAIEVS
jgi:hypothetical protein